MKKKLLSTVFALAMGATCAIGFTACGGDDKDNKEAEAVKNAIAYIDNMYKNDSTNTPSDFYVMGQTSYDGKVYTITWTVDDTTNVVIGTMGSDKKVLIDVNEDTTVDVSYKLTATITSGDASESVSFDRKIPAKAPEEKGIPANPYTAADVKTISDGLGDGKTYQINSADKLVYVKGYVTVAGTESDYGYGLNNVYIADTAGAEQADSLLIYSMNYNTLVTKDSKLAVGDLVIISGFIKNYKGTAEIVGSGSTYALTVSIKRASDTRTDAEKVTAALDAAAATLADVTTAGNVYLPASTVMDVNFAWASGNTTLAPVSGGKITVSALPEANTEVTLTITATCGEASGTKTVKVMIKSAASVNSMKTMDFSTTANRVSQDSNTQVWEANGIKLTNTKGESTSNIIDSKNPVRLYKSSTVKIEFTGMTEIVFHCVSGYVLNSIDATDGVTLSISGTDVKVTFATPQNEFTFKCPNQVRLTSLDVSA